MVWAFSTNQYQVVDILYLHRLIARAMIVPNENKTIYKRIICWNNKTKCHFAFFLALFSFIVMLTGVNLTGLQLER